MPGPDLAVARFSHSPLDGEVSAFPDLGLTSGAITDQSKRRIRMLRNQTRLAWSCNTILPDLAWAKASSLPAARALAAKS